MRFASAIGVARPLTPAGFGMVAMVSPILGFLSTFNDLGFGQAIVQSPEITSGAIKLSTAASPTLISMFRQNRAEI